MPENVSSIIYKFSQEVKRMLGEKLTKVIVYGSYARGDYRDNSDVDIMILVKSELLKMIFTIWLLMWR